MNLATKLWREITVEAIDKIGIYKLCQTEHARTDDDTAHELAKMFASTLDKEQEAAFWNICDINNGLASDDHNRGVAEGFILACELQTLINDPAALYHASEAGARTNNECYIDEINELTAYLKARGVEPVRVP